MEAEESSTGAETSLTTYGHPLMTVSSFKYMGRVLSALDDDWPVVVENIRKAQKKWTCL